jgi:hypothetical protein
VCAQRNIPTVSLPVTSNLNHLKAHFSALSNMRQVLGIAKMAKEGFLRATTEKTQYFINNQLA